MSYKILIVDSDTKAVEGLKSAMPQDSEVIVESSASNAINVALKELPHMVIVNIYLPNFEGIHLIENLRMQSRTKDISIIVLTDPKDSSALERCLHLQIDGSIKKPIELEHAKKSIESAIQNQSRFISSYTNRFIRAFINLSGTGFYAKQMSSAAKILCYKYEIDKQTLFDVQQVLGLLSSTYEKHSLVGIIRFYKDMDFALNLLEILENFQVPKTKVDHIIHAIYFVQKQLFFGKEIEEYTNPHVDKKILEETKRIYINQSILVEKGVDFELLWAKFSDFMSAQEDIDISSQHDFMTTADNFFKNLVIDNEGGLVHFARIKDEIILFVKPLLQANLDLLIKKTEIKNRDITLHAERRDAKESFLILKLSAKKELPKKVKNAPSTKIDARELFRKQNIDMQDMQILEEIEEDIFDSVSLMDFSKDLYVDLLKACEAARRYGMTIKYISEFKELSDTLIEIGEFARSSALNQDSTFCHETLELFEALLSELKRWREEIFIDQSSKDVHEHDSAILSYCKEILHIIQS